MTDSVKKTTSLGSSLFVVAAFLSSFMPSPVHATAATPTAPSEAADTAAAEKQSNINGGVAASESGDSISTAPVQDSAPSAAAPTAPPAAEGGDATAPVVSGNDFPPQPPSVSPPDAPLPAASPAAPVANVVEPTNSGGFYDANNVQTSSKTRGKQAPRRLDPAVTPGGKFVAVETSAAANSYDAQYVAASRALKLGRYSAAMEMFEGLYKKNRKDPRILMGLAVAQQGAGFNQSAAATYDDLLRIDPTNSDAIVNLMGILKAQYPDVTLKRLMELRAKYPANPGIPAQIGLVSAELKKYPDAIKFLEIASSMDPRNASHVYNLAIVTDRSGDWVKAVRYYERALELDASYGESAGGLNREAIYDRLAVLRRKS